MLMNAPTWPATLRPPTHWAGADPGAGRLPDAAPLVAPPHRGQPGAGGRRHAGVRRAVLPPCSPPAPARPATPPAALPLAAALPAAHPAAHAGAALPGGRRPEPARGQGDRRAAPRGAAGRYLVTPTGALDGDWWQVRARVKGRKVEGWASSLWLRRVDERAADELSASGCSARCRPGSARSARSRARHRRARRGSRRSR
jgi:hypothetical protein